MSLWEIKTREGNHEATISLFVFLSFCLSVVMATAMTLHWLDVPRDLGTLEYDEMISMLVRNIEEQSADYVTEMDAIMASTRTVFGLRSLTCAEFWKMVDWIDMIHFPDDDDTKARRCLFVKWRYFEERW